ncbi:hypothetical protein RYH73_01455 [Olivibacter sp. CPCC 100613]|uniref:hypothetical protein n=1 Tax=Olivibacter sp. CPCC 100613 TaxID=3079931 RepID=UPI002FF49867
MKNLKLAMTVSIFTILFSVNAFAQSAPKIIAVINKANWCSVCKANEERAMAAFKENNKDGAYRFVVNDLSNAETAKKSAVAINQLGLTKLMEPYQATGIVCLFDAKTKKPINQLLMSLSSEDIGRAMAMLKKDR